MIRSRFLHRLLILAMAALTLQVSGCAKDLPVFTPPLQRAIAASDQPWPKNQYMVLAYHSIEDKVADYKLPRIVAFVDALPLAPSGKVLKSALV